MKMEYNKYGVLTGEGRELKDKIMSLLKTEIKSNCEDMTNVDLRLLEQELTTSLNAFFGEQRLMKATKLHMQERKESH